MKARIANPATKFDQEHPIQVYWGYGKGTRHVGLTTEEAETLSASLLSTIQAIKERTARSEACAANNTPKDGPMEALYDKYKAPAPEEEETDPTAIAAQMAEDEHREHLQEQICAIAELQTWSLAEFAREIAAGAGWEPDTNVPDETWSYEDLLGDFDFDDADLEKVLAYMQDTTGTAEKSPTPPTKERTFRFTLSIDVPLDHDGTQTEEDLLDDACTIAVECLHDMGYGIVWDKVEEVLEDDTTRRIEE